MASYEDLFRYTSGRWLNDEQRQQALRYQRFNIDALKSVAASSARASGVTDIRKLAEGRCNKVFHIQLTEGAQVIARIPTPLSGRPHLVTANEVATMEFLRNRLGLTQVPRVLSWSSRSEDTPVGAEYIIMDVADGVELHSVWHQLSMKQRLRLVRQWTLFESRVIEAFSGISGYGSLYYRKDVPAEDARDVSVDGQTDQEFVLGPSTLQTGFWEDRYGSPEDVKLDCGPCKSLIARVQATQST
jgi:Phosphotransferase enzyme family